MRLACPRSLLHVVTIIIGDRGRSDSPNSSDGVVPYWSSHLKGAETEHIVPSDHSAHENPQAIADVLQVLKAHAD